jgi:hypothetical protein
MNEQGRSMAMPAAHSTYEEKKGKARKRKARREARKRKERRGLE